MLLFRILKHSFFCTRQQCSTTTSISILSCSQFLPCLLRVRGIGESLPANIGVFLQRPFTMIIFKLTMAISTTVDRFPTLHIGLEQGRKESSTGIDPLQSCTGVRLLVIVTYQIEKIDHSDQYMYTIYY